jgi:hypothetical protein
MSESEIKTVTENEPVSAVVTKPAPTKTTRRASARKTAAKSKANPAKTGSAKKVVKPAPKKAQSPAAKPVPAPKSTNAAKPKKAKLIRDSFTMPDAEYALLAEVKQRCLAGGVAAKKSEVLRAAFLSFAAKSDTTLFKAIKALTPIKTGRPPKHGKQPST